MEEARKVRWKVWCVGPLALAVLATVGAGAGHWSGAASVVVAFLLNLGWAFELRNRRRRLAERLRAQLGTMCDNARQPALEQIAGTGSRFEREFLAPVLRDLQESRELTPAPAPEGRGDEPAPGQPA